VDSPNYDQHQHTLEWLRTQRLFPAHITSEQPHHLDDYLHGVLDFYKSLDGMSPTYASFLYIVDAQQCEGYGEECWPARNDEGIEVEVGYALDEIFARRLDTGTRLRIPWAEVKSVLASKRQLQVVSCRRPREAGEKTEEGAACVTDCHTTSKTVWVMEDVESAKYVAMVLAWQWKFATVEAQVYRAVPMR